MHTQTTRIKAAHRRNRKRQRDGHVQRKEWRRMPATTLQVRMLRRIAAETGHTFTVGITRGDAWRRISQATTLIEESTRLACAPPWFGSEARRDAEASDSMSIQRRRKQGKR
jgi:hypothetical protein